MSRMVSMAVAMNVDAECPDGVGEAIANFCGDCARTIAGAAIKHEGHAGWDWS